MAENKTSQYGRHVLFFGRLRARAGSFIAGTTISLPRGGNVISSVGISSENFPPRTTNVGFLEIVLTRLLYQHPFFQSITEILPLLFTFPHVLASLLRIAFTGQYGILIIISPLIKKFHYVLRISQLFPPWFACLYHFPKCDILYKV